MSSTSLGRKLRDVSAQLKSPGVFVAGLFYSFHPVPFPFSLRMSPKYPVWPRAAACWPFKVRLCAAGYLGEGAGLYGKHFYWKLCLLQHSQPCPVTGSAGARWCAGWEEQALVLAVPFGPRRVNQIWRSLLKKCRAIMGTLGQNPSTNFQKFCSMHRCLNHKAPVPVPKPHRAQRGLSTPLRVAVCFIPSFPVVGPL